MSAVWTKSSARCQSPHRTYAVRLSGSALSLANSLKLASSPVLIRASSTVFRCNSRTRGHGRLHSGGSSGDGHQFEGDVVVGGVEVLTTIAGDDAAGAAVRRARRRDRVLVVIAGRAG